MKDILKVGAGKSKILIPNEIFPIDNFDGVHNELFARVLILSNENTFVIVSLDMTSLQDYAIKGIKTIISKMLDIKDENIWVCVTHTFSAPHLRSEQAIAKDEAIAYKNNLWRTNIEEAVKTATTSAKNQLQPVRCGFGIGKSFVNVNRDIKTPDGWWLGKNELGASDKALPVIRFDTMDGTLMALLYTYNVQSSIMDKSVDQSGKRLISSDLVGYASRYVEGQYSDNVVAIYCIGAAGDQAPIYKAKFVEVDKDGCSKTVDLNEEGFFLVKLLGQDLGSQLLKTSKNILCEALKINPKLERVEFKCNGQKEPASMKDLRPTLHYDYIKDTTHYVSLELLTIGDMALLGMKPEICSTTGMEIKKESEFSKLMIFTMVNGAEKYMADKGSYERNTYEAMNSKFAKGSAELLKDEVIKMLKKVK